MAEGRGGENRWKPTEKERELLNANCCSLARSDRMAGAPHSSWKVSAEFNYGTCSLHCSGASARRCRFAAQFLVLRYLIVSSMYYSKNRGLFVVLPIACVIFDSTRWRNALVQLLLKPVFTQQTTDYGRTFHSAFYKSISNWIILCSNIRGYVPYFCKCREVGAIDQDEIHGAHSLLYL